MRLSGVKKKTADYLARLVSVETSAPDMWIFEFLRDAEIALPEKNYERAREIVNKAADMIGISRALYDQSIWNYKSGRREKCS